MVSEQVPTLWPSLCASPPPAAPPIRSVSVGVYQCAHPFQWPSHAFLLCVSLCSSLPVTFTPFSVVQVPAAIEVFITMLIPFGVHTLSLAVQIPITTFPVWPNTKRHHQLPRNPLASMVVLLSMPSATTRACTRSYLLRAWPHTSPPDSCMKARAAFSSHQRCPSQKPSSTLRGDFSSLMTPFPHMVHIGGAFSFPSTLNPVVTRWLYSHRWLLMVPPLPVDDHLDGDFCFAVTSLVHVMYAPDWGGGVKIKNL